MPIRPSDPSSSAAASCSGQNSHQSCRRAPPLRASPGRSEDLAEDDLRVTRLERCGARLVVVASVVEEGDPASRAFHHDPYTDLARDPLEGPPGAEGEVGDADPGSAQRPDFIFFSTRGPGRHQEAHRRHVSRVDVDVAGRREDLSRSGVRRHLLHLKPDHNLGRPKVFIRNHRPRTIQLGQRLGPEPPGCLPPEHQHQPEDPTNPYSERTSRDP